MTEPWNKLQQGEGESALDFCVRKIEMMAQFHCDTQEQQAELAIACRQMGLDGTDYSAISHHRRSSMQHLMDEWETKILGWAE